MIFFVAGMCLLGVSSLVALAALWRYPRLWLTSLCVLGTAAGIMLYLPVREAFHRPSATEPAVDGFGIFAEFLIVGGWLGIFHLGLFLILIGLLVEEAKRRAERTKAQGQSRPG
jgi:hypothetical protein